MGKHGEELIRQWRESGEADDALHPTPQDACYCAETSTRNCPVHQNGGEVFCHCDKQVEPHEYNWLEGCPAGDNVTLRTKTTNEDQVNSPVDSASRAVSIELTDSLVKRFWNKVSDDGCWEWRGSKTRGYGTLAVGKGRSPVYAHRVSYAIHKGDPGNMLVLHHCDNPSCVNPDHLYLGTDQDNSNDAWERGRAVLPTNVPKEEDHPHGKLTASDVESIIKSLKAGFSCTGLADEFGVSKQAIWKIKHGQSWKEIPRG